MGNLGVAALAVVLAAAFSCRAQAIQEIIDPEVVKKDADFRTQGEYLGKGPLFGSDAAVAAQVIARSKGEFEVFVLKGGLPGEGWKRGDQRVRLEGHRVGKTTNLSGKEFKGTIFQGKLTLTNIQGENETSLEKVDRKSPTLNAKAPEGAKVLFDGTSADQFAHGTMSADKNLMSEATTKEKFGDYSLHLEFRLSYMPAAQGQARSNSGLYVHNCYEIQVLDSFGLEGKENECGGIYSVDAPKVNMCLPPLTWQTYDVDFTAPRYGDDGKKMKSAHVVVKHNGVVVQDVDLPKATPGAQDEGPAPRPFYMQGHGNKVEYRNIWLVEKK
jgi:hypothetical protein